MSLIKDDRLHRLFCNDISVDQLLADTEKLFNEQYAIDIENYSRSPHSNSNITLKVLVEENTPLYYFWLRYIGYIEGQLYYNLKSIMQDIGCFLGVLPISLNEYASDKKGEVYITFYVDCKLSGPKGREGPSGASMSAGPSCGQPGPNGGPG